MVTRFQIGEPVELHSLSSAALNGCRGLIASRSDDRFVVTYRTADGVERSSKIKPGNLRRCAYSSNDDVGKLAEAARQISPEELAAMSPAERDITRMLKSGLDKRAASDQFGNSQRVAKFGDEPTLGTGGVNARANGNECDAEAAEQWVALQAKLSSRLSMSTEEADAEFCALDMVRTAAFCILATSEPDVIELHISPKIGVEPMLVGFCVQCFNDDFRANLPLEREAQVVGAEGVLGGFVLAAPVQRGLAERLRALLLAYTLALAKWRALAIRGCVGSVVPSDFPSPLRPLTKDGNATLRAAADACIVFAKTHTMVRQTDIAIQWAGLAICLWEHWRELEENQLCGGDEALLGIDSRTSTAGGAEIFLTPYAELSINDAYRKERAGLLRLRFEVWIFGGSFSNAIGDGKRALKLAPLNHPYLVSALALSYLQVERKKAAPYFARFIEMTKDRKEPPHKGVPDALYSLAMLCFEGGEKEKGKRWLQKAQLSEVDHDRFWEPFSSPRKQMALVYAMGSTQTSRGSAKSGGRECHHCGTLSLKLSKCSRCKQASYCSTACQRAAWTAGHKNECVATTATKPLALGDRVRICGIVSKPELNGLLAIIVDLLDPETGRLGVQVQTDGASSSSGGTKRLKLANVLRVDEEKEEAARADAAERAERLTSILDVADTAPGVWAQGVERMNAAQRCEAAAAAGSSDAQLEMKHCILDAAQRLCVAMFMCASFTGGDTCGPKVRLQNLAISFCAISGADADGAVASDIFLELNALHAGATRSVKDLQALYTKTSIAAQRDGVQVCHDTASLLDSRPKARRAQAVAIVCILTGRPVGGIGAMYNRSSMSSVGTQEKLAKDAARYINPDRYCTMMFEYMYIAQHIAQQGLESGNMAWTAQWERCDEYCGKFIAAAPANSSLLANAKQTLWACNLIRKRSGVRRKAKAPPGRKKNGAEGGGGKKKKRKKKKGRR